MDCKVTEAGDVLTITPPYDRLDIIIPEDIADEVGRIYGYDRVPSVLPPKLTETIPVDKVFYYAEKVKNILIEQGYSEVMLYSLVPKGAFQIAYPLASDKAALREAITPKLTESVTLNTRNKDLLELNTIKLFEIGKVFPKTGEQTSLAMTGKTDILEKALGVKIPSSEVNFDDLIKDLPDPKDISDLNFKPLPRDLRYKPFSLYPFASRDIAVFVPRATAEKTVKDLIVSKAGKYLLKIRLFDTFPKGEEVSYAYRLVFQSYEKTLEESEINGAMTAVTEALNAQSEWKVR